MDEQQPQDTQPEASGVESTPEAPESTEPAAGQPATTNAGETEAQEQQPVDTPTQPPESTEAVVTEPEPVEEAGFGGQSEPEIQQIEEQQPAAVGNEGVVVKKKRSTKSPSREPTRSKSPSQEPKPKDTKGNVEVKIQLLDGEEKTGHFKRKVKAEEPINVAHDESSTKEKDFFSLYYVDEYQRTHKGQTVHLSQKIFLDPLRQVKSQLYPSGKQQQPWMLNYGVKFYVPDPAKLKEDFSRYLYCLQLCDDIRNNAVRVDRETAIRLTALMLQASLGDYEEEEHKPGYTEKYSRCRLLPKALQPENYEAQVIEVHKAKAGYTPAQAESEFLNIAKDLPRYGEHFFVAKDVEDRLVTVGSGCKGISLYYDHDQNDSDGTGPADLHVPWIDIVKISYKRRKFRIKYNPPKEESSRRARDARSPSDPDDEKRRVILMKFYTGDPPQAKRLWKNAVEQHTFFRLSEPEPPSILTTIFRRGTSFRYSGRTYRQTLRAKRVQAKPDDKVVKPDPKFLIGKEEEGHDQPWKVLDRPPVKDTVDLEKCEHQKVMVDFRLSDGVPSDTHRYVIQRDKSGSFEVLSTASLDQDKVEEKTYRLSVVDENSKAALVSVSLNVDKPESVAVTHGSHAEKGRRGSPVFDSERMPKVNLGGASVVTTSTMIEHEGKQLTTGEHSQRYPLEEVADIHLVNGEGEQWAGPAVDGSEEAQQVDLFLQSEHQVYRNAVEPTGPPLVEIVH